MKGSLLFIAIFALSMLFIPMIALNYDEDAYPKPTIVFEEDASRVAELLPPPQSPPELPISIEEEPYGEEYSYEYETAIAGVSAFRVLDETTGEIHTVPVRDFVRGAVAAEMPVSFHPEALKAQAVAAHTFALHNHLIALKSPDPALKGADFFADPSNMKVYITEEKAREFYGGRADEYWEKICEAADSVVDLVLEYRDEPIVAAYHAISAGQTEDAANLWSGSAPYLAAANSEGDLLAPDFETERIFTAAEFKEAFLAQYPDISFGEDEMEWVGEIERSPSGYVTSIRIGDCVLHGKDVRQALDLRSHNFEVLYDNRGFSFIVYGYGHGVGLSQYGADFMARQGAGFEEILENYYAGARLCKVVID